MPAAEPALDALDAAILEALQADGRLSAQELAERVGASTTVCWRRVKALNARGVVRRYAALVEPARAGVGEVVFARVRIANHSEQTVARFEREIVARQEVLECYPVMGDADYLLKIAVPGIAAYNALLQDFLLKIPGLSHVESSFALREVKNDPALPIARYRR